MVMVAVQLEYGMVLLQHVKVCSVTGMVLSCRNSINNIKVYSGPLIIRNRNDLLLASLSQDLN